MTERPLPTRSPVSSAGSAATAAATAGMFLPNFGPSVR